MMVNRFLLIGLLCLGCAPLRAQLSGGDSISGKVHGLGEVEVAARRPAANVVATKPIQQMDRAEIEALGLESLSDAVKKFAGVNVRDYGGLGGMKTVSIRNLGAHHTAVSYDGLTLSNTQAGQIDIGRFGLENIGSLSLSIGDNDDWMQSARHYAAAGMLSMESERPHFEGGKAYAAEARVSAGEWGYVKPSLRYWQRLGESTSLALGGMFMRSDGCYPFELQNVSTTTEEKRQNSHISSWQGEANLYHTFADQSQLDVKAYWYWSKRGLPGSVVLYANRSDETMWDEDVFAQATYKRSLAPKWDFVGRLKFAHSWNRYEDPRTEYDGEMQVDIDRQNEWYGSATVGWTPVRSLRIALAQDLFLNTLRTNIPIQNNDALPYPKRLTSLTALSAHYAAGRLKANANLVATLAKERVETIDDPDDRKQLSPTVALTWRLLPEESFYVRAMMKSTFRLPSFNDLYYRRSGNILLRPEKARLFDVGLTWHRSGMGALRYLSVTVDGYYNHVHDKIVAFPSTYIWRMANYGKVQIWGADATLTGEIALARRMDLTVYATYSYQSARNMTDASSQLYKQQLPYTPWHNGNLSATLQTPWVNVGYSLTFCGKRYSLEQNKPEYRVDAYWLHDLTLSREFRLPGKVRLNASLSAMNLFDEQYAVIKYYPMPGRSFRGTVTVRF